MYFIRYLVFPFIEARLAQSVERQALNLVVEGSSPSVGASFYSLFLFPRVIALPTEHLRFLFII